MPQQHTEQTRQKRLMEKQILDRNHIPCKYLGVIEQSVPYQEGSASFSFPDCSRPEEDFTDEICEQSTGCSKEGCPLYEPLEIAVCEKHGEYYKEEMCLGCDAEFWEQNLKEEQNYWDEMEKDMKEKEKNEV